MLDDAMWQKQVPRCRSERQTLASLNKYTIQEMLGQRGLGARSLSRMENVDNDESYRQNEPRRRA